MHSGDYLAALSGHYRNLYNQLIESNQEDEESDMEASDEEVGGMAEPDSDHLPLGTSFRDDNVTATCKNPLTLWTCGNIHQRHLQNLWIF